MEERKYELINGTVTSTGRTLYRVRALKDFADVKTGDIGGIVENSKNLSQMGNCWIYDNAVVFGKARVSGNAKISDHAIISDKARVGGDVAISDYVMIGGKTQVFGDAVLSGHLSIRGKAEVLGTNRSDLALFADLFISLPPELRDSM